MSVSRIHIGDYVMIGPNTLITTVNHPLTPKGRRAHPGIGKPVTIGDDVWIGGNYHSSVWSAVFRLKK